MILASAQALYLLSLLQLKGVGPAALKKAALVPGFERKAVEEIASYVPQIARALEAGASWDEARTWAEKQVEAARKHNARILSAVDPEYPRLLAETKDDPFILYVQGELTKPGQRSVAIIGTREPTRHGELVANRIATHFGEAGWSIVSGLAIGCDALAHQAALDCGAHTIAVMAHGLQITSPPKHRKLAQDILARGGAVVSEYPFGQEVQKQQYVKRDRTQAGMALGVVMIQSDIKGGSLHASRASLDYGRWLAVPYPTDRDRDARESKVQANLVIADGVPHERAGLLRCTTSALERVIVLRNKEDYWRLAESSGVEPFKTMPSVDRHRADVASAPWSAPDDVFDTAGVSSELASAVRSEERREEVPGLELVAGKQPGSAPSVDAEPGAAAEAAAVSDLGQPSDDLGDSVSPQVGTSGDVPSAELEPLQQDAHSQSNVAVQSTEPPTVDAAQAAQRDGGVDLVVAEPSRSGQSEERRRMLVEVKLSKGDEALGAAFGLWDLPKRTHKEVKKILGHAWDDRQAREFYARHEHLRTRLAELQRKLLAAKPPLKWDKVLAFRLAVEEIVLQISKLEAASVAVESLSRAERRRVQEEDWIEKGASDELPFQPENHATTEVRRRLTADLSALQEADLPSFVINGVDSAGVESSSDLETDRVSLQVLVERLNSVLKSAF